MLEIDKGEKRPCPNHATAEREFDDRIDIIKYIDLAQHAAIRDRALSGKEVVNFPADLILTCLAAGAKQGGMWDSAC